MVIFVGNFSRDTREQDLLDKFEQYGLVTSLNIMRDEISNHVLGFGFVEMPEDAAAHKAIAALNRAKLGDATLIVCETAPRVERRRFVQKQTAPKQVHATSRG
jgi:RNA recognition motif-containing protein